MARLYTNNAVSILQTTLSASSPTLLLPLGEGDKFPNPSPGDVFKLILEDRRLGQIEITDCTDRNGDQLTLSRGREGTQARTWDPGTQASHRLTAESLNNFESTVVTDGLQAQIDAIVADIAALTDRVDVIEPQYQIKVGGLYFSTAADNPASSLGYGVWEAYGEGRAIVCVGNNGESDWLVNNLRGSETHTLVSEEIPQHSHTVDPPPTSLSINAAGNHQHTYTRGSGNSAGTASSGPNSSNTTDNTGVAGNHTHTGSVDIPVFNSGNVGGSGAHNNVQPSIAVYCWRRTA